MEIQLNYLKPVTFRQSVQIVEENILGGGGGNLALPNNGLDFIVENKPASWLISSCVWVSLYSQIENKANKCSHLSPFSYFYALLLCNRFYACQGIDSQAHPPFLLAVSVHGQSVVTINVTFGVHSWVKGTSPQCHLLCSVFTFKKSVLFLLKG